MTTSEFPQRLEANLLTPTEAGRLIGSARGRPPTGIRNPALLAVARVAGCGSVRCSP